MRRGSVTMWMSLIPSSAAFWLSFLLLAVVVLPQPATGAWRVPWKQGHCNAGGVASDMPPPFFLSDHNDPTAVVMLTSRTPSSLSSFQKPQTSSAEPPSNATTTTTTTITTVTSVWQELPYESPAPPEPLKKDQRRRWWWGSLPQLLQQGQPDVMASDFWSSEDGQRLLAERAKRDKKASSPPPHPLRTDEYKLRIKWRRPTRDGSEQRKQMDDSVVYLEFAENGYVRWLTDEDDDDTLSKQVVTVGTWKLGAAGLSWKLRLPDDQEYLFCADLHPNPFGRQPKLARGLVIQLSPTTKQQQFRPIVGTFSGRGKSLPPELYTGRESFFSLSAFLNSLAYCRDWPRHSRPVLSESEIWELKGTKFAG